MCWYQSRHREGTNAVCTSVATDVLVFLPLLMNEYVAVVQNLVFCSTELLSDQQNTETLEDRLHFVR